MHKLGFMFSLTSISVSRDSINSICFMYLTYKPPLSSFSCMFHYLIILLSFQSDFFSQFQFFFFFNFCQATSQPHIRLRQKIFSCKHSFFLNFLPPKKIFKDINHRVSTIRQYPAENNEDIVLIPACKFSSQVLIIPGPLQHKYSSS